MSSSSTPLSAGVAAQPSRSASCFVAKPARGFQVIRIDGYSWTKALLGGERITSEPFTVGGLLWCVDYYPNGTDASRDESDAVALYLRLVGAAGGYHLGHKERVRAHYRFSLLDLAGNAAYERPAETAIFTCPTGPKPRLPGQAYGYALDPAVAGDVGCGYAAFIAREELERRRDSLLGEDCLAIRCDVGVTEVAVGENPLKRILRDRRYDYMYSYDHGYNDGGLYGAREGGSSQQEPPPDDKEFIRWCLAGKRPRV